MSGLVNGGEDSAGSGQAAAWDFSGCPVSTKSSLWALLKVLDVSLEIVESH